MAESPFNVCMVAPLPPPYGGISHWTSMVSSYAKSQCNLRLEIVDIAPRWRLIHDLSPWKRILGGSLQTLRDSWRLLVCLRKRRPNVIHLTTSGQLAVLRDLVVMLLAGIYLVPVIYHIRFGRVPVIAKKSTCEWLFMSLAMRLASTVIAIDRSTFDVISEYLPQVNVQYVPNCINLLEFSQEKPVGKNIRKVIFIGWVIPTKGIEELIAAWSQLELTGWQLDIVGPGDQDYRNMLIDNYQPENVIFHGELDHGKAMAALSESDCFVLPSYTEGFPNVVVEAMALGKPIVATRVGAIPEMLDGECGILIKSHSVAELKAALQLVLGDEKLRITMGTRAQKKAQTEYSLEIVFEKYLSIWRQAAGKGE